MSEKEIDNIFKSKLRNRQFEFNPENWKAMEQMLNQRPSAGPFYWWSTAAILSFGILVFVALNFYQSPVSRDVVNGNNNISNTEQQLPNKKEINTAPTINAVDADNENQTTEDASLNEKQTTLSLNSNSQISDNQADLSKVDAGKIENKSNSQSYTETSPSPVINNETETVLNTETASSNASANTSLHEEKWINLNSMGLPRLLNFGERELLESPVDDPYIFRRYNKQQEWWVSAGPNFSPAGSSTGMAAAWFAEINYRYSFSKQWGLETGLGYFARNSPDINWSSDSIFYNFGQEVIRTEVENKRLDYINLPLKVTYNLNERHQVNAGVYTAFLVNVHRNVTQTHIHFKGKTEVNEMKQNGLSENLRTIDYGFSLGYLYQHTPQLGMGIQIQAGLTDITKDKPALLNDFHRNVNTRLVLRYRLF